MKTETENNDEDDELPSWKGIVFTDAMNKEAVYCRPCLNKGYMVTILWDECPTCGRDKTIKLTQEEAYNWACGYNSRMIEEE